MLAYVLAAIAVMDAFVTSEVLDASVVATR